MDGNALNNLTVTDVRVVNIGDVLKGNNVEAFNNALNRNNVAIDVLSGGVTLFVQPVPAP